MKYVICVTSLINYTPIDNHCIDVMHADSNCASEECLFS